MNIIQQNEGKINGILETFDRMIVNNTHHIVYQVIFSKIKIFLLQFYNINFKII